MNPTLVDTHCHLTSEELYGPCERIIREAADAGVTRIITVACSPGEDQRRAMQLKRQYPQLAVALGFHPHEAARLTNEDWTELAESWRDPDVVAFGEMGLDYHYDFSPRSVQQDVFKKQLELANILENRKHASENAKDMPPGFSIRRPIVIHCRQAFEDVVRILDSAGYAGKPVVFHCYSEPAAMLTELRQRNWRPSFTGVITFKKSTEQQQACVETPLNEILFETDAPWLTPEPMRKIRPNTPALLTHTVRFAAMLRGIPYETLAAASTANAEAFFRLR